VNSSFANRDLEIFLLGCCGTRQNRIAELKECAIRAWPIDARLTSNTAASNSLAFQGVEFGAHGFGSGGSAILGF
jgi:hypothetical protein